MVICPGGTKRLFCSIGIYLLNTTHRLWNFYAVRKYIHYTQDYIYKTTSHPYCCPAFVCLARHLSQHKCTLYTRTIKRSAMQCLCFFTASVSNFRHTGNFHEPYILNKEQKIKVIQKSSLNTDRVPATQHARKEAISGKFMAAHFTRSRAGMTIHVVPVLICHVVIMTFHSWLKSWAPLCAISYLVMWF